MSESLQAELQQPLGLTFLLGDEPDDVFVESCRNDFRMYVGSEAELVFLFGNAAHQLIVVLLFFGFLIIVVFLVVHGCWCI